MKFNLICFVLLAAVSASLNRRRIYAQAQLDALSLRVSTLTVADISGLNGQFEVVNAAIELVKLTPGPQGPQGAQGESGLNGSVGAVGADGADGVDGVDGTNGTNGVDGAGCTVASVNFNKNDCTNQGNSNDIKSALKTITCGGVSASFCTEY